MEGLERQEEESLVVVPTSYVNQAGRLCTGDECKNYVLAIAVAMEQDGAGWSYVGGGQQFFRLINSSRARARARARLTWPADNGGNK